MDKIIAKFFKIQYYYFVVLSIINLIFIYFKIDIGYTIVSSLMILSIVIQMSLGVLRGMLGITGLAIITALSIYFIKEVWLGIALALSIYGIINFIINIILNKLLHLIIKITNEN